MRMQRPEPFDFSFDHFAAFDLAEEVRAVVGNDFEAPGCGGLRLRIMRVAPFFRGLAERAATTAPADRHE